MKIVFKRQTFCSFHWVDGRGKKRKASAWIDDDIVTQFFVIGEKVVVSKVKTRKFVGVEYGHKSKD